MKSTRHRLAIVLVLTLTLSLVAPIAIAADNETTSNETDVDDRAGDLEETDGRTLDELRDGGREIPGADPSMRWIDDGSVFVEYGGSNPIFSNDREEWEVENVLGNGARVRVDELTMHAQRERGADRGAYDLEVVYWSTETRVVENSTATVPVVESSATTEITFDGPFDREPVRLQRSDEERHVTMWLVDRSSGEPVDGARWTFRHESMATSANAGVESEGDYLWRAIKEFIAPIVMGSFLVGSVVSRGTKRAGIGPQWGYFPWILALTVVTLVGVMWHFSTLADLVVRAPLIIAAYAVGIVGIVVLESQTGNIKRTLFVRPHLVDVSNPRGEKAVDSMLADATEEDIVELPGGARAVVRPGLLPFLSRCFGGLARLETEAPLKTELNLVDSPWDELVFVDPDADSTLEYTPEGWRLEIPEIATVSDGFRALVGATIVGALIYAIAGWLSTPIAVLIGIVIVVAILATPTETSARVDPATGHERAAFMSMFYLASELDDAETIEEAREKLIREKARGEREVDDALELQDATLIEEMHGSKVDRQLRDEGDDDHRDRDDSEPDELDGVPADD